MAHEVNDFDAQNIPWDFVIRGFKKYVFMHFGPRSWGLISTALTTSELRNQIPTGIIQKNVRQLLVAASMDDEAPSPADQEDSEVRKRKAEGDDSLLSQSSKLPKTAVSTLDADERVLMVVGFIISCTKSRVLGPKPWDQHAT